MALEVMDKESASGCGAVEEGSIPVVGVRLQISQESSVPKSLDSFFLREVPMASASELEDNVTCQGQRSLVDMEVHTVTFETSPVPVESAEPPAAGDPAHATAVPTDAESSAASSSSSAAAAAASSSAASAASAASVGSEREADGGASATMEESELASAACGEKTAVAAVGAFAGGIASLLDGEESGGQVVDFPPVQNFFAGNPMIEVTKGLIHLYTPKEKKSRHLMVCLLAIPADMMCSELVKFVSPFGCYTKSLRIVRDSTPNQYMALVDFYTDTRANEFFRYYHGRPYNMLEPAVCTVAFVSNLEILKTEQGASLPASGATEVPNCPICLERMDESILTALCNHRFHTQCLIPWKDNRCPLCRYVLSPEPVGDNRCMDCDSHESLWICLICGHVGCGRYVDGHARSHFLSTQHTYAMDVTNQSVWDYAGDNFVHRLVQSTTDGKLVEVQGPSAPNKDAVTSAEKSEGLQLEYTFLLTSQLESQRLFFEEKLSMVQEEMQQQLHKADHQTRELDKQVQELQEQMTAAERLRLVAEKKLTQVNDRLTDSTKQLTEEKEMNQYLRANQLESQQRLELASKAAQEQVQAKEEAIKDLEEQLRDVMFYVGAQREVADITDDQDRQAVQDGQVSVGAAAKVTPTRSQRKKRR